VLCVAASLAVAMFAFGAGSAFAADSATCAFTGLAGNLTPPIPAAANDPGGPTTTETGTYQFAGNATCVAVEGDTGDAATNSGVYSTHITSSGNYTNLVCGTGTATSTAANTTLSGFPSPEGPVNTAYTIRFTAGAGALQITGGFTPQHSSVTGGGYVQIVPAQGNCANTDVSAFTVAGSFTGVAS
jgi:hypothetical protein